MADEEAVSELLMRDTFLRVMRNLLLCVVGVVPAFFLVFATLFSDHDGGRELVLAYGLTLLAYLLLAFVASLIWLKERLSNAAWLLLPAVIIVLLYLTQEPQIIPVGIAELSAALVGSLLGTVMGASLRLRTSRR